MKVRFAEVSQINLANVHITDGQLVVVKDTGDIYYDNVTVRQKLTDVIPVTTLPSIGIAGKLYLDTTTHGIYMWDVSLSKFMPISSESISSGDIYQYPLIFDPDHRQSALSYGRILGMATVLEICGANNPSITLKPANPVDMSLFGIADKDGWITTTSNYDTTVAIPYVANGTGFVEIPTLVNAVSINTNPAVAGINLVPLTGPGPTTNLRISCLAGVTKFRVWVSVIPDSSKGITADVTTNSLKSYTPYFAPYTITVARNLSGAYDTARIEETQSVSTIRTHTVSKVPTDAQMTVKYRDAGANHTTSIKVLWPSQISSHTMTSVPLQTIPASITVVGSVDATVTLTTKQSQLESIINDDGTAFGLGVEYEYTSATSQTVTAALPDILTQLGVTAFTLHELLPEAAWASFTDTVNDITVLGKAQAGTLTLNTTGASAKLYFASDWKLAYTYRAASGDTSSTIAVDDYDYLGNPLVGISAIKLVCIPSARTSVRNGGKRNLIMTEQVSLESVHSISTTKYDWMGDLTSTWVMTAAELDALDPIWAAGATIHMYAK